MGLFRKKEFSDTRIAVGLGNPGTKYAKTFHNLGFLAVERLANELNLKFKSVECKASVAVGYLGGKRIVLARPQTYMNLSGESVRELLGRYKASLGQLIVVYDDIDIPKAKLRLRQSGSAGTHNGMRSVVDCLRSEEICRLRIGVGSPPPEIPLADFVLMPIPENYFEEYNQALDEAVCILKDFLLK